MLTIEAILSDAGIEVPHKDRGLCGRFLVGLMETGTTDPADLSVALLRRLGDARFSDCWRTASPLHRYATQGLLG